MSHVIAIAQRRTTLLQGFRRFALVVRSVKHAVVLEAVYDTARRSDDMRTPAFLRNLLAEVDEPGHAASIARELPVPMGEIDAFAMFRVARYAVERGVFAVAFVVHFNIELVTDVRSLQAPFIINYFVVD